MIIKNLEYIRTKNRFSNGDFAEKLNISYAKVGNYIRGEARINIDTLVVLSEKFNVSCDDLLKKDLSKSKNKLIGMYGVKSENPNIEVPLVNEEREVYKIKDPWKDKYIALLEDNRRILKEFNSYLKRE